MDKQVTISKFLWILQKYYWAYLEDENALDYIFFDDFEVING